MANIKPSPKTNIAGIGAIIGAVGAIITGIANSDNAAVVGGVSALIAGIGLLCARDNDKSSEDVGAK